MTRRHCDTCGGTGRYCLQCGRYCDRWPGCAFTECYECNGAGEIEADDGEPKSAPVTTGAIAGGSKAC